MHKPGWHDPNVALASHLPMEWVTTLGVDLLLSPVLMCLSGQLQVACFFLQCVQEAAAAHPYRDITTTCPAVIRPLQAVEAGPAKVCSVQTDVAKAF